MSQPNTALPPRYDVADPARNWIIVGGQVTPISPLAIVLSAQRMLGVTADGAIGPNTVAALRAQADALPASDEKARILIALSDAVSSRRVNAVLWTARIGMALNVTGDVALGTHAQASQVRIPGWNNRHPGSSAAPARTGTGTRTQPPTGGGTTGGQQTGGGLFDSLTGGVTGGTGGGFMSFVQRNRTPLLIGGAVLLVGGVAAVYYFSQGDEGDEGSLGGMSTRRAAALLGVPENADPSSIRAAYARAVRFVHPDSGYRGGDSSERIRELQAARQVLESQSMRLAAPRSSGRYYDRYAGDELGSAMVSRRRPRGR